MSREKFEKAKNILGKPDVEAPGVAIYRQDCLEGMKALPPGIVDLTITSPPYNIGKEYEQRLKLEEYVNWCAKWIADIHRITVNNGAFWLNVGYCEVPEKGLAVPISYLLWDKTPFYLIQEIVWNYGAGVACRKRLSPRNEKFLWYVKDIESYTFNLDEIRDPDVKYPNQKKNGKLKCNPLGKNPSDVWQIPKVTSGKNRASKERTPHPAQFPIQLIERVIKGASNENDLVLDPFMGSGSVAEAAARDNRYVIGFELESNYIEHAKSRLENFFYDKQLSESQAELSLGV